MKVLFLTEAQIFYLIPQEYPEAGDVLALSLTNEMTSEILTPAVTWETVSNQLKVTMTAQPAEFETQQRYAITLKNNGAVIYYGKLIILESGTDVQNYEYKSQSNVKFGYK